MTGTIDITINHAHLPCGLGGGAKGFNRGQARVGQLRAKFRCLGGIDNDPAACRDFERIADARATCLDLFSRAQYIDFHGREPPPDWREATPDDIRGAYGNEHPHIVFMSAPCKGFSGLLSETASRSKRYQALNALTLRIAWLIAEAYKDDPVELIVFENVPRIATRGRGLLDQIIAMWRAYGYMVAETTHDCGNLGGLGQSRKRFLMVARHAGKVPPFLYEPPHHPLRSVGSVLERLPMPGDLRAGPMHRMPALQWKTWVRLALVRAGSDWRSLNDLRVHDGALADYAIVSEAAWRGGVLGVKRWDEAAGVIAGESSPTNGAFSVADPRVDGHPKSIQLGVRPWSEPAGVVTGDMWPGCGANAIADPRIEGARFNNAYRIVRWDEVSPAVAGPGGPGGGLAVADPRADGGFGGKSKYRVTGYDEPAGTVIAASTTGHGAFAVADPRTGYGDGTRNHCLRVTPWDETAGTVTSSRSPGSGATCIADPRYARGQGEHQNKMRVEGWDGPAHTVTGSDRVGSGALSIADPRPAALSNPDRAVYLTGGHYGVVPWTEPSGAVTASGQADNGRWSVADPRLPEPTRQLVCVIRALDGTWHRPFTTFECSALQGLVDPEEQLELDGLSDSAWRERIGNAVPPPSAEAIAGVMGRTLLLAWSGETFMLSTEKIWVRQIAVALSVRGAPLLDGIAAE